jgi:Xaa-Pro dipeptidase
MDLSLLTRLYADHVQDLTRRTELALRDTGFDALVIHSGSLQKRSAFDDQYWPLRPVPHFQHWCPLAQPDCAIVLVPGKKAALAWLKAFDFWENPNAPETLHFTEALRVVEITRVEQVKELVPAGKVAFVGEDVSRAALWGIDAASAVNPVPLLLALDALRVTKTAYEVLCLEEANRRAAAGHAMVLAAFKGGDKSELDLHLDYLRATRQDDAETPYKNIVALGENAATLHHVSYVKHPSSAPAQSLLLDAGASYQGYCSDITRTWVKGTGATASAFASLIDGVEKMQQRLCSAVKIGLPYEELHDDAHRQVATILRDVGLAKLSAAELVASHVTRAFFPHGLGVLSARPRALARSAMPRRGVRADQTEEGESILAQYGADRGGAVLHDRAGRLLHRRAARAASQRAERERHRLEARGGAARARRRSHRGRSRRRRRRNGRAQSHPRVPPRRRRRVAPPEKQAKHAGARRSNGAPRCCHRAPSPPSFASRAIAPGRSLRRKRAHAARGPRDAHSFSRGAARCAPHALGGLRMGVLHAVVQRIGKALRPLHAGEHSLACRRTGVRIEPTIDVTSDAFTRGAPIPLRYTNDGANVSPPLRFRNVPPSARELVLLCEDPDAPMPVPFVHWLVYRLSPETRSLPEGIPKVPEPGSPKRMRQGKNGMKKLGYSGPAPPPGHGVHHYHYELFALDAPLDVSDFPTRDEILTAMQGHVIAFGELVGMYERI